MMTIYETIAVLVGVFLLSAAGFVKSYHMGESSSDARWQAKELAAKNAQEEALIVAAEALAAKAPAQQKIIERVTHETTKPVYLDCRNDAGVMRDINAAITGEPSGDSELPKAGPAE